MYLGGKIVPIIRFSPRFASIVLFVLGVGLYANTIGFDYALDDEVVMTNNRLVQQGWAGIPDLFSHGQLFGYNGQNDESYRPLPLTTYAIETALFGGNPAISHALNALLYGLLLIVLFHWLRKVLHRRHWQWALVVVALFAVHPLHTEVVANVKGRDELLAFLFGTLALLEVWRWSIDGKKSGMWLAPLWLILGLLCKETTITFLGPAVLMIWVFGEKSLQRSVGAVLPLTGAVVVYLAVRSAVLSDLTFSEAPTLIENSLVGAESYGEQLASTILLMGKALLLFLFPHPLSIDYSFNEIPLVGWGNPLVWLSVVVWVGLTGWSLLRLPKRDPLAFGWLWVAMTYSVASNLFIVIHCTLGERFLFVPSLGFALILGLLFEKLAGKRALPQQSIPVSAILVVLILAGSWKTIDRNGDWQNNSTLFAADAESAPNSARLRNGYASILRDQGWDHSGSGNPWLQQAVNEYNAAVVIYPEYWSARFNLAKCHYRLGNYLPAYQQFTIADSLHPGDHDIQYNRALSALEAQKWEMATQLFDELSTLLSHDQVVLNGRARAYHGLGISHAQAGDREEAIRLLSRAIEMEPSNGQWYSDRGITWGEDNRDKGIADLRRAVGYAPKDVTIRNNLGYLLLEDEQWVEALAQFDTVLAADSTHAFAFNNRGKTKLLTGDVPGALQDIQRSINLLPENALSHYHLALTLLRMGREAASCEALNRALELGLDPTSENAAKALQMTNCP